MPQLTAMRSMFKYQSGRVVALGRVMLCVVLLVAVAADRTVTHVDWVRTYSLLIIYAIWSVIIAAATWRNWWLDARLAIVTHGIDMAVFTAIVFSANGTTSPFFLFFVLPLLAAAIRWSWRETALTATALILLYVAAGMMIAGTSGFEIERFIIRAGNLMILSLLLIWFGIHQSRANLFFPPEELEAGLDSRTNPLGRALEFAMRVSGARAGMLIVGPSGEEPSDAFALIDGESRNFTIERPLLRASTDAALLFDVRRDHALARQGEGRFRFPRASAVLDREQAEQFGIGEGLLSEIQAGTQQGWLILWRLPDLSADYVQLGRELGGAAGAILARHALLAAVENGAAARTRLSLARDVHDSIVQFLAGAAIRLEAIKRLAKSTADIESELDELKRLMIEEQGELRGFVTALRRDRSVELREVASELRALAERLSQQWSVACRVSAANESAAIPIRLQLDLVQLLREGVANAVRHGQAKNIDVDLAVADGSLLINVADDGVGFPAKNGEAAVEPWSLKERVERANGSLRLLSSPGSTEIRISLPIAGAAE